MRRLLTGYAVKFNRRHRRIGHVFQNRYKSILVEEEPYLLELVRYIHLNPIRVGLVKDLQALDRYPWTGHSALLGRVPRSWQAVTEVLGQYSKRLHAARRAYRNFVRDGLWRGRRPELQGGGLRRSAGGWQGVAALLRGRERWTADERILGGPDFVERMLQEAVPPSPGREIPAKAVFPVLIERVVRAHGLTIAEVCGGSRRKDVVAARAAISVLGVRELGLPLVTVARTLGVSLQTVLAGVERGSQVLESRHLRPEALLVGLKKPK
jgi:hypothetical protein